MALMKTSIILLFALLSIYACKEQSKPTIPSTEQHNDSISKVLRDTLVVHKDTLATEVVGDYKSKKALEEALKKEGFKVNLVVDKATQDTIIMQQYFMVFFKQGPVRVQNEEETEFLNQQHLEHLEDMKLKGFTAILADFPESEVIKTLAVFNVPNIKTVDSLTQLDPMVKAGRLALEIHPWWTEKESKLY
jgi:uncharacterized protein YciI